MLNRVGKRGYFFNYKRLVINSEKEQKKNPNESDILRLVYFLV